jgi:UDP-glucose 4-epimerase
MPSMLEQVRGRSVVVTGGAGFIGSELVAQLVAADAKVSIVDNLVNGKRENLSGLPAERATLHVVDVLDEAGLRRAMRGASLVYHLACLGVRHSLHDPMRNHEVNATGALRVLHASREAGVQRVVYVSSSEVYGTARWTPMSEDHPTMPNTVYGASKLAGECYARAFWPCYGLPTVIVRPFNSFGPRSHHEGDSGEVIPKFMLRCMAGMPMHIHGDGTQTRDFTYVADTARGILLAGFSDEAIGQTFNLGTGREIQVKALAQLVAEVVGRAGAPVVYGESRPGDVLRLSTDAGKARAVLGFEAHTDLRAGLRALLSWYRSLGIDPKTLLEQERTRNWALQPAPAGETARAQ